mgnify:CR=1 FL=1
MRSFLFIPADSEKKLSKAASCGADAIILDLEDSVAPDDKEQARVKKEIGADDAEFVVDPAILGGLVLRAGDRVIDGSVRSGLTELSSRLN